MRGICVVFFGRSITGDVFIFSWSGMKLFAYPPFILLLRVLRKIVNDKAKGVVVVSWWSLQVWFLLLCYLLTREPIIFPPSHSLLSSPFRDRHPVKDFFLGDREFIRLALLQRKIPSRALEATLASLADSTIRQYSKSFIDL